MDDIATTQQYFDICYQILQFQLRVQYFVQDSFIVHIGTRQIWWFGVYSYHNFCLSHDEI